IVVFPLDLSDFESTNSEYTELSMEKIIQNRDLSLYDKGEVFSDCNNQEFRQLEFYKCKKTQVKARDFIFNHWKAKKRGYIIYEWTSCDNEGSYHIFIEPDKNSRWHIILRTYQNYRYEIRLDETKVHSLNYKRATNSDHPFPIGSYYLSLLDKNGQEIWGL
ncbi:MAG TPA: hypothetical protein PKY82_05100, partial [Pyrinomonadaceae bacterium]|nr:hypothetical protein [Pyrinomonadaceae bacterium]